MKKNSIRHSIHWRDHTLHNLALVLCPKSCTQDSIGVGYIQVFLILFKIYLLCFVIFISYDHVCHASFYFTIQYEKSIRDQGSRDSSHDIFCLNPTMFDYEKLDLPVILESNFLKHTHFFK